ncbi:MAG: ABC transporter ATP-binding protein [Candidatus Adiutrix sp.]|jgi:NitT/TauT family transport system ATP-binding protein|nr:ABC transporter ATP-binding protein [Candidatus Adiutrix sp.]
MGGARIQVQGLGKDYGGQPVFRDLAFSLDPGGSLAFVGSSGCGKSTLLHILAGLIPEYEGRAVITPGEARQALAPQHFGLFPWKNAWQNVELPLILNGQPPALRRRQAAAMLKELGLDGLERRYPAQLSGGQRQRLALGRALAAEPDILLLDEPFSSLDAITREGLQNLTAALWRRRGLTLALATHSIEEAVFLGGRILVLGGRPTRIVADLDNPGCGRPEARFEPGYFTLVKAVRRSLEEAERAAGGPEP